MKAELILKVVAWRILSILITLIVLFAVTGDTQEATWITILLHTIFTVTHYIFERLWESKIKNKINEFKK